MNQDTVGRSLPRTEGPDKVTGHSMYVDDLHRAGMLHGAFTDDLPTCVVKFIPLHTPAVTMSFNTQLADITAKDRPGTGFVPFGAVA